MKPDDKQLSELYRQTHDEAPPAHLDAAILKAARKATARRPRAVSPFSGRWQVPAALAAALVVAVLLVPLLEREPVDSGIPASAPVELEESLPAAPGLLDRVVPEKTMQPEQQRPARQGRMPGPVSPRVEPKAVARSKKREAGPGDEDQRSLRNKAPAGTAAVRPGEEDVVPALQWLETISALLKAGEVSRAGNELQAFLKQYPDYSLPPELLELRQRSRD